MMSADAERPWDIKTLGSLSPEERAEFYDDLSEDALEEHLFFPGGGESRLYENPRLEVCILDNEGTVVPAAGYSAGDTLRDTRVNVYVERYFVEAMPGQQFDLQVALST